MKPETSKATMYTKLIETELYHYEQTKKEFEIYKEELFDLSERSNGVKSGRVANPTQAKALSSIASLALKEMERRMNAIEYAIKVLSVGPEPRKLEFLEKKYLRRTHSDTALMQLLAIEQATFYRWKKEIIGLVAERLGLQL